jgi:hypothetical protein
MTARFSREFQVFHSSDKEEGRRRSLKESFNHFALVATHCFVAVLSRRCDKISKDCCFGSFLLFEGIMGQVSVSS